MCPSTTETDDSILVVRFEYNGELIAELSIAQYRGPKCRECIRDLPFIDMAASRCVDYISEDNEIDPQIPIQVYCGNNEALSRILLLEETEYDLKLEIKDKGVTDEMKYLSGCKDSMFLRPNRFENGNTLKLYTLYSKSYVGKGYFDLKYKGALVQIPFEVRSKKIEYLNDYPQMLADIAEYSATFLLNYNSPLYRNYSGMYKDRKTLYEDFLVLDYVFSKCDFVAHYEFVNNNRYCELLSRTVDNVEGSTPSVDISRLMSSLTADNLIREHNGVICGKYNPIIIPGVNYTDTFDVPENRLVKDLLLTLQSMIYSLKESSINKKSVYIQDRLSYMKDFVDTFLSDQWMNDIGNLTYIPYESTVLQCRQGYSNLFFIYQMLNVGIAFNQKDIPSLFEGHNKKVYEVYEYWCFLRLHKCLYELSSNKPELSSIISESKSGFSLKYGKPIMYRICIDEIAFIVKLYYNKPFSQNEEEFRSYSIKLRPDYTLLVTDSNCTSVINFDAKYKLKIKEADNTEVDDSKIDSGCWEYDIYKMHTYRDALIQSLGSYVLYPGKMDESVKWTNYIKPIRPAEWGVHGSNVIPSVGAISLTPGYEKMTQLKTALVAILMRIPSVAEEVLIDNIDK